MRNSCELLPLKVCVSSWSCRGQRVKCGSGVLGLCLPRVINSCGGIFFFFHARRCSVLTENKRQTVQGEEPLLQIIYLFINLFIYLF